LRIWHCRYKSLEAVSEFGNLEELVVASFPEDSFGILRSLRKLRLVSIVHLPKVSELTALSELPGVESLSLATSPGWDAAGKCSTVNSLEPITMMRSLKHLELFGVCTPDRSLAALERCSTLRTARFSKYPAEEVERFYRVTTVVDQFNPAPSFE
jgi:hypothetical protein